MRDDNKVMNIIMIILFFVFLGLIIWAQKTVSVTNLMIEIVGLIGLLTLLFFYILLGLKNMYYTIKNRGKLIFHFWYSKTFNSP